MEDPTLATSPPPPNDLTNPLTTSTSPPSSNVGSQPHLHPVKLKLQEFLRRSEFKTKSEKEEEEGEEGIEEGKEEEKGGELFLALRALALVSRGENNGKFHHNSSQVPTPLATPSLFPPTTTTSVTSTITSTQFEPPAIRKTLDLQTHQVYRAYLEELKKLDESVERLERNLVTSHDRCIKIETTFKTSCHTASELSKTLLELDTLKKTTESRSREVEDFLTKYTLPPEEMEKLQDPAQVVDHKFLDLVEKLHRLEGEANLIKNQGETLGQDILNALVACRTTSDYRLEEYLNSQLKLAVDTKFRLGNLDPDPLMQRVVMALNLKVNRWLEEVIKVRLDHLQENFVVALSQGARPIELHAPDPIRYVGDMLAWVHQVIVEEKEFYFNLFSINFHQGEDHHRENSLSHHTKLNDLDYLISKLRLTFQSLNRSVDGVLLLLTERVQHVLRDLEGPALGFQLSNLIHIHGDVLLKNLGVASLPPAIKSKLTDSDLNLSTNERILNLITFSQDAFYQILEDDMAQLLAAAELPPDNLSVPTSVHTALDDLVKIISHPDVQDPVKVLDTVLDPLVQLCDREASFVDAHESSIYIINCLTHIQNCLSSYSVASNRIESFAPIITHNLELLVELEYEALMDLTHLNQLMPLTDAYHHLLTKIMDGDSQETAMDEFIQLCLDQNLPLVHTALQSFETFLYTVDLDQDFTVPTTPGSPTTHNDDGDIVGLKRLKLPTRQVYQLRTQALSHFLNSYSSIYPLLDKISTKVKSDPELPPFPYRLRPVAELETLLGI